MSLIFLIFNSNVLVPSDPCKEFRYNSFKMPKKFDQYQSHTDAMGIDLGTTTCVLSVSRNNEIHTIPIDKNGDGDYFMPSCVAFDHDPPLVGHVAERRLRNHRDYVLHDMKNFTQSRRILDMYNSFLSEN